MERYSYLPHAALVAMVLVLSAVSAPPAAADWPPTGRQISNAPGDETSPKLTTDGGSGAIIVWQDSRSSKVNIFARRVLASGIPDPAWPAEGLAVLADSAALSTATAGQTLPRIVSDGSGGAIVVWQDFRSSVTGSDIYAQHLLPSGVVDPTWPPNGRALCTATGGQGFHSAVEDGAGGAIVTWSDLRISSNFDVFAQHVFASGAIDPRWPVNGVNLSEAPGDQAISDITFDGSGGAIVSWTAFQPGGSNVFAQHVTNSGSLDPAWPSGGRALSLAIRDQRNVRIVSDRAHGAIAVWEDLRDLAPRVYALRLLSSGQIAPGWPADGLIMTNAGGVGQNQPVLASDGGNGAIVVWEDFRSGTGNTFAQHLLGTGAIDANWPADGRQLSQSLANEQTPSIVGDGAGGAIVAWDESHFIMTHHVLATGGLDPAFPMNGRILRNVDTIQAEPAIIAAGPGNGIVAFTDTPGIFSDVYAMIVTTSGALDAPPGTPPAHLVFAAPTPNPARDAVALHYSLPHDASVRMVIYDAAGRRVRGLIDGVEPAGTHSARWDFQDDAGARVHAGIYLARLEVDAQIVIRKVARIE